MAKKPATSPFGSRPASQAAQIDNALTSTPKTTAELAEATGLPTARVASHLKHLLAKKLIQAKDGRYRTKPSDAAKSPQTAPKRPQAKAAKAPAKPKTKRAGASGKPAEA